TVVIGTQTWFQRNLNYDVAGSKCNENSTANCNEYGRLYNLRTAMVVCPSGWHLPSDAEWTVLVDFVGGTYTAGTKLKATSGWNFINGQGNGTDMYCFPPCQAPTAILVAVSALSATAPPGGVLRSTTGKCAQTSVVSTKAPLMGTT
ncbi:MAG: hypothetical protein LBC75_08445, partial [Fibromonadaceae bacterium]|nr:hypothetical protein [Fibromonadaceae bacterium]